MHFSLKAFAIPLDLDFLRFVHPFAPIPFIVTLPHLFSKSREIIYVADDGLLSILVENA